jgi:DNA-binding IclR family transcriptional regulator
MLNTIARLGAEARDELDRARKELPPEQYGPFHRLTVDALNREVEDIRRHGGE